MKFRLRYLFLALFFLPLILGYKSNVYKIDYKNYYVDYQEEYNDYYVDSGYYDNNYDSDPTVGADIYDNSNIDTSTYLDVVVNGNHVVIQDDANLLTPEEEEKLSEEMKKITEYGNVLFKTINYNSQGSTAYYARKYYHDTFGNGVSGTMFLIDMQYRMIYIFSDGKLYDVITKSKADIITDNVYRYASREDYYGCASEAFSEIYTLLAGGKINAPMKIIANTILSLVIAALIGFLLSIWKARLKSPNTKDIVKLLNKKVEVHGDFTYTKDGQRRVYSPQTSDSGGSYHSSGGSSGGGGGSSGGGGGHRF